MYLLFYTNKKVKYFFAHQKNIYICRVKISYFSLQKNSSIGEMAEWSIVAVSKTVVPSGTGGSNPPLSAINLENQYFAEQTPSFTPKNVKLGVFH